MLDMVLISKMLVGVLAIMVVTYLVAAVVVWVRWPLLRPSLPRLRGQPRRIAAALGALGAVAVGASVIASSAWAGDPPAPPEQQCQGHRRVVLSGRPGHVVIHVQDSRGGIARTLHVLSRDEGDSGDEEDAISEAEEAAREAALEAEAAARDAEDDARAAAQEAREHAREAAREARERAREAAQEAREQAREAAEQARERAREMARQELEQVGEQMESFEEEIDRAHEAIEEEMEHDCPRHHSTGMGRLSQTIEEQAQRVEEMGRTLASRLRTWAAEVGSRISESASTAGDIEDEEDSD